MRIVLTGCTRGIGRATAVALLAEGHEVFGLVRDPQAAPDGVSAIACDLERPRSLRTAIDQLPPGPIDALVHNAGLFLDTPQVTPEGLERMWAVHVVAPLRLTDVLKPRLAPGSRIVFVASTAYARGDLDAPWRAAQAGYRRAKLGQVLLARGLAEEASRRGITVHALHPGVVRTDIGSRHTSGLVRLAWQVLRSFGVSPERAAETVVRAITGPDPAPITTSFLLPRGPVPVARAATSVPAGPFLEGLRASHAPV